MTRESLIIADAGPIIVLAAIGRLGLLQDLAAEVVVPRTVFTEVVAGAPRPGAAEIAAATWVKIVDGAPDLMEAFRLVVDPGEAEALAVAKATPGSLLVVDDLRARRVARELGIRLTGTLGILDLSKRAKLLDRVRPELERLAAVGFRIDEVLMQTFLQRLGE